MYKNNGSMIEPGTGTIEPLDKWNSQILNTGIEDKPGVISSAHYFTYHQEGFAAIGFYQNGARFLDVRDPTNIKQIGYWFSGIQEAWGAEWVPERDEHGRVTGNMTNLVYVKDPTRGIDILEITLPDTPPAQTLNINLEITLDQILLPATELSPALQQKITHSNDKKHNNDHDH